MPRSLKVRQDCIGKVRAAVRRNGYLTQQALAERLGMALSTVGNFLRGKPVDHAIFAEICQKLSLDLEDIADLKFESSDPPLTNPRVEITRSHRDFSEAPDVVTFYGRKQELSVLEQWILHEQCKIVALLGMGGIGKTTLVVKLANQIKDNFEYVILRRLINPPPVTEILTELIHFFSQQQEINLPDTLEGKIFRLLHYFRSSRCLVILDNLESVFQGGTHTGQYKQGYEGYGDLLTRIGEVNHQSCLILTSREKPKEVVLLEGSTLPVRSLLLSGLTLVEGREIFHSKGCFAANEQELQEVCNHYAGNPLALKIAAATVQEVCGGDLGQLMPFLRQGKLQFADINDLLERQFSRLSLIEQQVMYWLAVNREPVSLQELEADFVFETVTGQLLNAVQSLKRRTLVEPHTQHLVLQPVLLEYVTHRIISGVCDDIANERQEFFNDYALVKAQSKEHIRQAQIRFILRPVIDKLVEILGSTSSVECRIKHILANLRQQTPLKPGYAVGNMLNILCDIKADINDLDCSHLEIRQAYLADVTLHNINFTHSQFIKCVFKQTFGAVLCVVFSPDGEVIASSDAKGEINLWRVADGQCLLTMRGHTNWVRRIAFSPNGQMLASTSTDGTIRIWDVQNGRCLQIIQEYSCKSYSVCFSHDGRLLASSGEDWKVRIWDVQNRQLLLALDGHTDWVLSASFSPDSKLLASGSRDQTIRIWDLDSGKCLKVIVGHDDWVVPVIFSPDGRHIASASFDQTVRIWSWEDGECLHILSGHTNWVWAVAYSPDGQLLASTGVDQTIRIWDTRTSNCLHVITGHTNQIWSVAFHPDGQKLASGGDDQTIRFWDTRDGKCLKYLSGYTNSVRSVAFDPDGQILASAHKDGKIRVWDILSHKNLHTLSGHHDSVLSVAFGPDGQILASGSQDQTVKLWHLPYCTCLLSLEGHTGAVSTVAFSPNAQYLASGSLDKTIRIWDINNGACLYVLTGHDDRIGCVAFSPVSAVSSERMGSVLASASEDKTVKLWDVCSGECLKTLQHQQRVWSVAFSPDGKTLASGCLDNNTIHIWDLHSGECLHTLVEHTGWVMSVVFSHDGNRLISCSSDQTIKIWDVKNGQCLHTIQGHRNWIWSVALNTSKQIIASASEDEVINLWNEQTGECLATMQAKKPYEGMNIKDVTGLSMAQEIVLKTLGAVKLSLN